MKTTAESPDSNFRVVDLPPDQREFLFLLRMLTPRQRERLAVVFADRMGRECSTNRKQLLALILPKRPIKTKP